MSDEEDPFAVKKSDEDASATVDPDDALGASGSDGEALISDSPAEADAAIVADDETPAASTDETPAAPADETPAAPVDETPAAPADESTTVIPVVSADSQDPPTQQIRQDQPTQQFAPPAPTGYVQQYQLDEPGSLPQQYEPVIRESAVDPAPTIASSSSRNWVKPAVIVGGVCAVAALAYGVDMFASSGKTPRGTQVAGIDIGDRSPEDAESTLRDALGPRLTEPVAVQAGDTDAAIVPTAAGIDVDWSATLAGVNEQPANPITRITSFFASRSVPVVSSVDRGALGESMKALAATSDRAPVEGTVTFAGGQAQGVSPAAGQALDLDDASGTFVDRWADGGVVTLPVDEVPVTVTQSAVDRALREVAQPAVSGDVVVNGRDGTAATLTADKMGEVLSFVPDGSGGLTPQYNVDAAIAILAPQLAPTEIQPQDASFTFSGGRPSVVPGVVGDLINWPDTVKDLPALVTGTASRAVPAAYGPVPPALTTEAAEGLGINEVIGEFTTGGFEYASGVNIALAASEINGAVVKPGDTFSLNEFTGPRGAAQGYVESGIINNGRPSKAVGGGISQLATTLYNATYFAGMEDVAHTEHSYYISRYPAAREATIFDGAIDLQFRNSSKTGVMIQAIATSSDVTVRIWGTKSVDVTSSTGPRTKPTTPDTVTLPKGPECVASSGAPGFTVSDTRVVTDHASGAEISSNTRTVKYDPVPIVKCE